MSGYKRLFQRWQRMVALILDEEKVLVLMNKRTKTYKAVPLSGAIVEVLSGGSAPNSVKGATISIRTKDKGDEVWLYLCPHSDDCIEWQSLLKEAGTLTAVMSSSNLDERNIRPGASGAVRSHTLKRKATEKNNVGSGGGGGGGGGGAQSWHAEVSGIKELNFSNDSLE